MLKFCFAAAMALLSASPVMAQAAPVPTAAHPSSAVERSPKRLALGRELASVLNSEDLTRRQIQKLLDDTLPKSLAANSDFVALEEKYPGISAAFIEAMRPIIIEGTAAKLPVIWDRLAPVYAEVFTEPELAALLDFYRSPLGVKIIRIMGEGADFSSMMGTALRDADAPITQDGLKAGLNVGIVKVQQTLTPAEIAEVARFEQSAVGQKLPAATAKAQTILVAWSNEPSPEIDTKIEVAVTDAVKRYVDAADKQRSEKP